MFTPLTIHLFHVDKMFGRVFTRFAARFLAYAFLMLISFIFSYSEHSFVVFYLSGQDPSARDDPCLGHRGPMGFRLWGYVLEVCEVSSRFGTSRVGRCVVRRSWAVMWCIYCAPLCLVVDDGSLRGFGLVGGE